MLFLPAFKATIAPLMSQDSVSAVKVRCHGEIRDDGGPDSVTWVPLA